MYRQWCLGHSSCFKSTKIPTVKILSLVVCVNTRHCPEITMARLQLHDTADIVCVICVVCYIQVYSQSSCPSGWFGSLCNYKCRCVNNSCDDDGECTRSYTCQGGWFGPSCQYADMAYRSGNSLVITDGDDSTCTDSPAVVTIADTVKITLNESIFFTWLRVGVQEHASDFLDNVALTFSINATNVSCHNLKKQFVNTSTVDMYCEFAHFINVVYLTGAAVSSLCSVYVSGGRNVALKETALQDVTYFDESDPANFSYVAALSVDGDTQQDFSTKTCSSTFYSPTWTLILSQPRMVHRYFIYNRNTKTERMQGFRLESFDSNNRSLFTHLDMSSKPLLTYSISSMPLPVTTVVITVNNIDDIINLCEVEVYGESICENDRFGRDCEQTCHCKGYEDCLVSTGFCPSRRCVDGYTGPSCNIECSEGNFGKDCRQTCTFRCRQLDNSTMSSCDSATGACLMGCKLGYTGNFCENECSHETFGDDCASMCSKNCEKLDDTQTSPCNHVNGACTKGCKSGYTGLFCSNECAGGWFGKDCNSSCSKHCQAHKVAENSTCDHETGACVQGCKRGFSGQYCESGAVVPFSSWNLYLVIGLCTICAVTFYIGFCLSRKRQPRPNAEKTADTGQPPLTSDKKMKKYKKQQATSKGQVKQLVFADSDHMIINQCHV